MSSARSEGRLAVLMIGTSLETQGGVSTVVREMLSSRLTDAFDIRYISTHCDGSMLRKLLASLRGILLTWRGLLGRPRLLHVHLASRASFWRKLVAMAPAWVLRVPVLVHLHGAEFRDFHGKEVGLLGRALIGYVMKRSARVVPLSQGWKNWLDVEFPLSCSVTIPNSIGLPTEEARQTPGAPVLLFMGRLGERKGTSDLLRAFAQLHDMAVPPRLVLAGDGEIAQARELANKLRIAERVDKPGWIARDAKARLFRNATVYVLPSYNEGLPMSVLEAMSYGLPVVSTPVGGIPDAVTDGEEGFLVAPGDVSALSARLRQLLESPALVEAMGSAGRRKIEQQFATDKVMDCWAQLYAELGVPTIARPKENL